jgi:hypothetical protein
LSSPPTQKRLLPRPHQSEGVNQQISSGPNRLLPVEVGRATREPQDDEDSTVAEDTPYAMKRKARGSLKKNLLKQCKRRTFKVPPRWSPLVGPSALVYSSVPWCWVTHRCSARKLAPPRLLDAPHLSLMLSSSSWLPRSSPLRGFRARLLFVASTLVSSSGLVPGGSPPRCSARNLTPTRFLRAPHLSLMLCSSSWLPRSSPLLAFRAGLLLGAPHETSLRLGSSVLRTKPSVTL